MLTPGFTRPNAVIIREVRLSMNARRRPERALRRRHVHVVFHRILRNRRQHSDHGVRAVVHLEKLADDVRIAAVAALPVFVAQNQNGVGAVIFIGGDEGAAQHRLHAQHIEEIRGDHGGVHALGRIRAEQQEIHGVMFHHGVQRVAEVAIIENLLGRERNVVQIGARRLPDAGPPNARPS